METDSEKKPPLNGNWKAIALVLLAASIGGVAILVQALSKADKDHTHDYPWGYDKPHIQLQLEKIDERQQQIIERTTAIDTKVEMLLKALDKREIGHHLCRKGI